MIAPNRLTPMGNGLRGWKCDRHDLASTVAGWTCPRCSTNLAPNRALSREAGYPGSDVVAASTPRGSKPRAGQDAEDSLARQLEIAGYRDLVFVNQGEPMSGDEMDRLFVRGFAFGLYLNPARKYQADFAFPALRLLVEVDGGAHYATRKQGKHDTERRGLAASIGWTIVPVTPEMVRDGTALPLIEQAIAASRGAGGGNA